MQTAPAPQPALEVQVLLQSSDARLTQTLWPPSIGVVHSHKPMLSRAFRPAQTKKSSVWHMPPAGHPPPWQVSVALGETWQT